MEECMIHIRFVPDLEHGTVSPSAPQFGGVQGDRNAAQVTFLVPEELRGDDYRFRIEGEDGAGAFVTTAPLPLDDEGCVSTLLDERFTAAGGQILVRLVVSEIQNDNEVATVRSFDGRLFFADAPAAGVASPFRDTLSALLCRNEEKLEQMNGTAAALSERVSEFNARVGASEGMLMSHGTRLTAAESRLTAVEGDVDALENDVDALESGVSALETRADVVEGDVSALESGVNALETQLTALNEAAERKETETTPWKLIQKLVRAGCAPRVFAVGDTLIGHHAEYGVLRWKVVAFDHDTAVDPTLSHSMTLQLESALHRQDGAYDKKSYDAQGTNFTPDWERSDVRAWLNSAARGGQWYTPGAATDTTPNYAAQDGFVRGFEGSFLEAIGPVKKSTAVAGTTTSRTRVTNDLFFLPSRPEVYGGNPPGNTGADEGSVYAAYGSGHSSLNAPGTGADTNRVRTCGGAATTWLLRSIHPLLSNMVLYAHEDGSLTQHAAETTGAVVPMCCIV